LVAALNDAGAVIVDENGNSVPLGSQQAAEILGNSDPYFFDGTNTVGFTTIGGICAPVVTAGHCNHSNTPLQDAITAAPNGATVYVEPGEYNESPNITKSLTLQSTGGSDVTKINLQTGPTYLGSMTIGGTGSNVTINGFTITGFDAVGSGLASSNIFLGTDLGNVNISNNRIQVGNIGSGSNGDDGFGIITTYNTNPALNVDSLTVTNNIFEAVNTTGTRAFYINPGVTQFTFQNNQIDGNFTRTAITQANNGLVDNNTVTGSGSSAGLGTWGYPDPNVYGQTTFSNNTITGTGNAISIFDTNTVTVQNNNLDGNGTGVRAVNNGSVSGLDASTITVKNNSLGNNTIDVSNGYTVGTLNASGNWWGTNTLAGVVGSIFGSVDTTPWLNSGTDTSPAPGFQGDFTLLNVSADGLQSGSTGRIQEGVNLVAGGGTVNVGTGNYREQVVIDGKNITLQASGPDAVIESPDTVPLCFATPTQHKSIICVKNAPNVIIKGLTIDGRGMADQNGNNRFDGIGYYNAGGTVQGNTIEKIRDPSLSGVQNGVGLYAYNLDGASRSLNVFSNNIFDYQKNGMALSGNGLTVNVQNNTVTGAGATPLTAQNGIQLSYGAVGTISGNTVSGNFWTGTYCSGGICGSNDPISDPTADGAAGILLYQPGSGTIQVFNNTVLGNQFGIASVDTASMNIHDNTIQGIAHNGNGYPAGILLQGSTGFSSTGTIQNNTIIKNDYGVLAFNTPNIGVHNNSITNSTIYGVWSDKRLDATNNWWGDASGPLDNSAVPDVCGVSLDNPIGTGTKASTCVLYNPWLLANPFAGSVTVPPSGGEGGNGRGQTESSTGFPVVPVTGGQQTTISCESQSVTIKIEDIKVTLTALCGYDVVLEKVSKDNLPGALGEGNNLEDGVLIKILKGGKVIETLPVDASLSVAYPKPANSDTSVLTWNGNGWQEQVSYINGNDIVTDLAAPSTLVLVTH
jgi:hypothetical protein